MKALLDGPAFNIGIFALLLSLPWELGQMRLYTGCAQTSDLQASQICMAATAGDPVTSHAGDAIVRRSLTDDR